MILARHLLTADHRLPLGAARQDVCSVGWGGCSAVVAWTSGEAVVHTGRVEIEISGDTIRLGQLLKFANLVTDGGEAKALIVSGMVRVDGEPEIRRGRQVGIGSRVDVDLPHGREELRVVQQRPVPGS